MEVIVNTTIPPTPAQLRDAIEADLDSANAVQERIAEHVIDSLSHEGLEALFGMLTRLKIREHDRGFDRGRRETEAEHVAQSGTPDVRNAIQLAFDRGYAQGHADCVRRYQR